jgi:hypothetical protein
MAEGRIVVGVAGRKGAHEGRRGGSSAQGLARRLRPRCRDSIVGWQIVLDFRFGETSLSSHAGYTMIPPGSIRGNVAGG